MLEGGATNLLLSTGPHLGGNPRFTGTLYFHMDGAESAACRASSTGSRAKSRSSGRWRKWTTARRNSASTTRWLHLGLCGGPIRLRRRGCWLRCGAPIMKCGTPVRSGCCGLCKSKPAWVCAALVKSGGNRGLLLAGDLPSPLRLALAQAAGRPAPPTRHRRQGTAENCSPTPTATCSLIGFGTGLNLPHYPAKVGRITTVDPNPGMHRLAQRRIKKAAFEVDQRVKSGERLPCQDNTFDCAVSTFTLCSIEDVGQALAEVYRVLSTRRQVPVS